MKILELNKNKRQKMQILELSKGVKKWKEIGVRIMSYFGLIKSIFVFIICFLMLELSFGFLDLVLKSIEGL